MTASQLRVIALSIGFGLLGGGLAGWIVRADVSAASATDAFWTVALWLTTYVMLVHCYLFGFFNPGETARRIRLLIELRAAGSRGMSIDEILGVYNAHAIIEARLHRLLEGGQIKCQDGRYVVGWPLMLSLAKVMVLLKLVFLGARTEFEARGPESTRDTAGQRVAVSGRE